MFPAPSLLSLPDTRFEFRGFHGCQAVCGLKIIPFHDGRTLVVCTELPENKGTSVTNFAEELATLVCRQFNVEPDKLVWVEHYPASPTHGPNPDWDQVTFDLVHDANGTHFEHPRWRPMREEDWREFEILPH